MALFAAWAFAVPVYEAPDEPAHWQYARYVRNHWSLPYYQAGFEEANSPPLAYLLFAVPLGRLADRIGAAPVFLAGHVMLVGCYLVLRTVGPASGDVIASGARSMQAPTPTRSSWWTTGRPTARASCSASSTASG